MGAENLNKKERRYSGMTGTWEPRLLCGDQLAIVEPRSQGASNKRTESSSDNQQDPE